MSKLDEKPAYDYIYIQEKYKTYFGLQFWGFYIVNKTLPLGIYISNYWHDGNIIFEPKMGYLLFNI